MWADEWKVDVGGSGRDDGWLFSGQGARGSFHRGMRKGRDYCRRRSWRRARKPLVSPGEAMDELERLTAEVQRLQVKAKAHECAVKQVRPRPPAPRPDLPLLFYPAAPRALSGVCVGWPSCCCAVATA